MPDPDTPFNTRFLFPALLILFAAAFALAACLPQIPIFQPTPAPTQIVLSRGERLYNENCLVCHGGATGGQMMDYPPRHNANGDT